MSGNRLRKREQKCLTECIKKINKYRWGREKRARRRY